MKSKTIKNSAYRGIRPLANSQNGILCDFVPPIVTIKISAAKHIFMPKNVKTSVRCIL